MEQVADDLLAAKNSHHLSNIDSNNLSVEIILGAIRNIPLTEALDRLIDDSYIGHLSDDFKTHISSNH